MYLRIADKLIKQGDYAAALDAVVKARQVDPQNRYAIAIEARVRNLIDGVKSPKKEQEKSPAPPAPRQELRGTGPEPADLPSIEGQLKAIATQIAPVTAPPARNDHRSESQNLAILSKIASLLGAANDHLERHEYDRALEVVSRAALLDPSNEDIRAIEKRIRSAQEEARRREEEEQEARTRAERLRREHLMNAELDRLRREQDERRLYEEAERKKAQKGKTLSVIHRAREFLAANQLQEAQCELAFVSVLDPENPDVIALERDINARQEEQHRAELEAYRLQLEEQRRRENAVREEISHSVKEAETIASQGRHAEALRIVIRAFILDPTNSDLQACEQRILSAEKEWSEKLKREREAQQEALRKKLEEEERRRSEREAERLRAAAAKREEEARQERQQQILRHLRKAHEHLAANDFPEAHAEVAAAYAIDPFDQDVLELERRIAAEQTSASQRSPERPAESATPPEEDPDMNDLPMEEAIEEVIARTLAEAKRLSATGEFDGALEQIAIAYSLDPENSLTRKFDDSVRKEMAEAKKNESQHPAIQPAPPAPSSSQQTSGSGWRARALEQEHRSTSAVDTLLRESLPVTPELAGEEQGLEKHWRRRAILAAIVLSALLLLALSSLAPPLPVTQPAGQGWSTKTHHPPALLDP